MLARSAKLGVFQPAPLIYLFISPKLIAALMVSGRVVSRIFSTSSRTLSGASSEASSAHSSIALSVSYSMVKPSLAENLRARNIRSASSVNLSLGFPTQRMQRFSMSLTPSNGSASIPSAERAIAFIEKSRRPRSVMRSETKVTESGLR